MDHDLSTTPSKTQEQRHYVVGRILFLYILPTIALSGYAHFWHDSWGVLALGLMLSAAGSFACFCILREWEQSLKQPMKIVREEAPPPDFSPYEARIAEQQQALEMAQQQQAMLEQQNQAHDEIVASVVKERDGYQRQADAVRQEFQVYKNSAHEQLEHHKLLLTEQQRTIGELRDTLEKRQQHIQQLESRTRDLHFELKTLLLISEKPVELEPELPRRAEVTKSVEPDAQFQWDVAIRTPEEAHVHLKRCLDIAQRMMGASHFSNNSRFKDLPMDSFALDLRRLFDRFRDINASTILVYSPKEHKILFVNDHITPLLGLAPDKFLQQFQEQLQTGIEGWKTAIDHLAFKNESRLSLSLKAKTGQEVRVDCSLGIIPTGLFRNYVIGLLY